ncbi:MAG: glycosyltransferase [Candidatus Dormibacteria bacterium]
MSTLAGDTDPTTPSQAMPTAATIAFFPEGAYGPTNNCVAIGDALRARGHRVVFIIERSFAGALAARGFEERLVALAPPPDQPEVAGQFWTDYIRETARVFRRPTIEQLSGFIQPTYQALVDGARYVDDQLRDVIDELAPDVIVEDNVVSFPALLSCGRPWVRIVSCNPAELPDRAVPPAYSGYPTADRAEWDGFREQFRNTHAELHRSFSEYCVSRGAPPLPELQFTHESPWLNLTLYPEEVDYGRERPLGPLWHNLEACVRRSDAAWSVPDRLAAREGALLYLSLGSLGSADVGLMQRLIDTLATTPHRVVVSMGPEHAGLRLADNMAGAEFLPQPSVLPLMDAVITHGGNNTVTECLHAGLPMVLLPLFWDQHDNAQRIDETGYGVRLPTYSHDPRQLTDALDGVLADNDLNQRLQAISRRLQASPGDERAAALIERLATERTPVLRT